jgi:hypothetical protein
VVELPEHFLDELSILQDRIGSQLRRVGFDQFEQINDLLDAFVEGSHQFVVNFMLLAHQ